MFMRTVDLYVCASLHSIHGIRISMSHDPEKDPGRSEYLNDYYSQTIVPDLERTFYTKMLGLTDGHCDYVTINENE